MAAIIAQMSRAKSERGKRKRFDISKCVYTLDPFDQCFDPDVSMYFIQCIQWHISIKYRYRNIYLNDKH